MNAHPAGPIRDCELIVKSVSLQIGYLSWDTISIQKHIGCKKSLSTLGYFTTMNMFCDICRLKRSTKTWLFEACICKCSTVITHSDITATVVNAPPDKTSCLFWNCEHMSVFFCLNILSHTLSIIDYICCDNSHHRRAYFRPIYYMVCECVKNVFHWIRTISAVWITHMKSVKMSHTKALVEVIYDTKFVPLSCHMESHSL